MYDGWDVNYYHFKFFIMYAKTKMKLHLILLIALRFLGQTCCQPRKKKVKWNFWVIQLYSNLWDGKIFKKKLGEDTWRYYKCLWVLGAIYLPFLLRQLRFQASPLLLGIPAWIYLPLILLLSHHHHLCNNNVIGVRNNGAISSAII